MFPYCRTCHKRNQSFLENRNFTEILPERGGKSLVRVDELREAVNSGVLVSTVEY